MSNKKLSILFKSSLDNLTSINPSFDKGVLGVAYHGKNRKGSFISRETFESCIHTIFNCPIVCNYSRETDSIGQHDIEIVNDDNGLRMVNITQPIGVIPESAEWYWEEREEDDGETHEYLCVDALIWKRQEAYKRIKENGITDQSMEINIRSGRRNKKDGLFHITSFDFLAFCLLESAEPCYESAGLDMFALDAFRSQYVDMMADFKEEFSRITSGCVAGADKANYSKTEGGKNQLNKDELMGKYDLTENDINFNLEGLDETEIEEKFAELKNQKDQLENLAFEASADTDKDQGETNGTGETDEIGEKESVATDEDASEGDDEKTDSFALTGQCTSELITALKAVTYIDPRYPSFGECQRYYYVDHDSETMEVFAYDDKDWKVYGFKYAKNGDGFVIDFDHPKRKKSVYVDFDEGDPNATYNDVFGELAQVFDERFSLILKEIEELTKYRLDKMGEERADLEHELFAQFADIAGVEAFESLKKDSSKFSMDELEEKCFAIRGRNTVAKFSNTDTRKSTRVPVEQANSKVDEVNEPYGGLFKKYRPGK